MSKYEDEAKLHVIKGLGGLELCKVLVGKSHVKYGPVVHKQGHEDPEDH